MAAPSALPLNGTAQRSFAQVVQERVVTAAPPQLRSRTANVTTHGEGTTSNGARTVAPTKGSPTNLPLPTAAPPPLLRSRTANVTTRGEGTTSHGARTVAPTKGSPTNLTSPTAAPPPKLRSRRTANVTTRGEGTTSHGARTVAPTKGSPTNLTSPTAAPPPKLRSRRTANVTTRGEGTISHGARTVAPTKGSPNNLPLPTAAPPPLLRSRTANVTTRGEGTTSHGARTVAPTKGSPTNLPSPTAAPPPQRRSRRTANVTTRGEGTTSNRARTVAPTKGSPTNLLSPTAAPPPKRRSRRTANVTTRGEGTTSNGARTVAPTNLPSPTAAPPPQRRSRRTANVTTRGEGTTSNRARTVAPTKGSPTNLPSPTAAPPPKRRSRRTANVTTRGEGTTSNRARTVAPTKGSPTNLPAPTAAPVEAVQARNGVGNAKLQNDELKIQEIERALPSHFPRRPAQGTLGRSIQLIANYFSVEIPSGNFFHYDVEICSKTQKKAKVPEKRKYRCISTKINRLVMELLVKKYRVDLNGCMPAYDGRKNLYTRCELKFRERTFTVDFEEDQRIQKFIVKIQYAATVNLDVLHAVFDNRISQVPQEVLQAVDIVMRHGPSIKLTPVGRCFFQAPSYKDYYTLGGGREVWFGYYASVRPAQWKPMLNIDMSATAFYQPLPVTNFMCKLLSEDCCEMSVKDFRELHDSQIVRLNKELKGLRIKVTHLPYPRKYKVVCVTKESAKKLFFNMEDGSRCSVADYFQNRYRRLSYPNLPCIQTGSTTRPVYLPLEVCAIVEGQHCKKKLDENQTSEMIKRTAQPPAMRFNQIHRTVRDVVSCSEQRLHEFEINISTEATQLRGRVLDPPSLVFENNSIGKPREGTWELRGRHFYKPATLTRWTLLNLSRFVEQDSLDNFVKMLIRVSQELGMRIEQPLDVTTTDASRKLVRNILLEEQRKTASLEMVIIVLTKNTNYAEIKQVAETEIGLRTQCVMDNNVIKKCNTALITNLCQKINAKLDGINNSLLPKEMPKMFEKPVIIIGADVTHPAPEENLRPSIAACVGSLDAIPSKFHASIRIQMEDSAATSRLEIIMDLKGMMKEMLVAFYRATRHKPEKIIFFRDGVSEGQFMEVRNREVSAIRLACQELSPNETYEPALTFIVVQKRHHTRFIPANDRDGVGKCGNVPPGTIVDSVVTHPLDFDFYLCSHFGIQGTSRPSHYYIVWDDSSLTADELQKLCYYLCHTYARCSRSVSIPAPVYYAHLAAYRARNHVMSKVDVSSSSSDSSGGGANSISTTEYVEAVNVHDSLKTAMYFV
ncbi:protein argonaute-2-like isoform X2 [Amblyomma americanum]